MPGKNFSVDIDIPVMRDGDMAQRAELKTQASALGTAILPVQSGSKNYEQKIWFTEPALLRYSYDETDQKGNRIINPSLVAVDVKGKWMYVVLEADFKGRSSSILRTARSSRTRAHCSSR